MGSFCGANTSTVVNQQNLNPTTEAALNGLLGYAQQGAGQGYQQYPFARIAGFSPDQNAAFGQIQDIASNSGWQRQLGQAGQYAQGSAAPITTGNFNQGAFNQYGNPFQQSVINTTDQQIQRQAGIGNQQIAGNAAEAGAYGGDRATVAQAENQRNALQTIAQTNAGLNTQNWQQAQQQFNTDTNRQLAAQEANRSNQANAANLESGLAGQGVNLGTGLAGQLNNIGQQQQGLAQQNLNLLQSDFYNQQYWPQEQARFYSGILNGFPYSAGASNSTTSPGPSLAGQIGGLGLGAFALNSATGGSLFKGIGGALGFGSRDGGRIGYASGGNVEPVVPISMRPLPYAGQFQGIRGYAGGGAADDGTYDDPSGYDTPTGIKGERAAINPFAFLPSWNDVSNYLVAPAHGAADTMMHPDFTATPATSEDPADNVSPMPQGFSPEAGSGLPVPQQAAPVEVPMPGMAPEYSAPIGPMNPGAPATPALAAGMASAMGGPGPGMQGVTPEQGQAYMQAALLANGYGDRAPDTRAAVAAGDLGTGADTKFGAGAALTRTDSPGENPTGEAPSESTRAGETGGGINDKSASKPLRTPQSHDRQKGIGAPASAAPQPPVSPAVINGIAGNTGPAIPGAPTAATLPATSGMAAPTGIGRASSSGAAAPPAMGLSDPNNAAWTSPLMAMAAGMLASKSPFALTMAGEGLQSGMQNAAQQRQIQATSALKRAQMGMQHDYQMARIQGYDARTRAQLQEHEDTIKVLQQKADEGHMDRQVAMANIAAHQRAMESLMASANADRAANRPDPADRTAAQQDKRDRDAEKGEADFTKSIVPLDPSNGARAANPQQQALIEDHVIQAHPDSNLAKTYLAARNAPRAVPFGADGKTPDKGQLLPQRVYMTPAGNKRWNGTAFEAP